MFHHQTKKLATLAIGLGLIFTPATSFAENAIAPAQTTQAKSSTTLKDISFQDIRNETCLLYTSPSPRDRQKSRMPSSA